MAAPTRRPLAEVSTWIQVISAVSSSTMPRRTERHGHIVELGNDERAAIVDGLVELEPLQSGVVGGDPFDHHRRVVLADGERVWRNPERIDEVEPAFGLVGRRKGSSCQPPQRRSARAFDEPLAPSPEEIAVDTAICKALERLEGFPQGEVDDHQRVVEDADVGGIAGVRLQPPEITRRAFSGTVHERKGINEIADPRIIDRMAQRGDVELGEVATSRRFTCCD